MKRLELTLKTGSILVLSSTSALAVADQVSINAGMVSEQVVKGISQTNGKPSLYVSTDINFDVGFYIAGAVNYSRDTNTFSGSKNANVALGYFYSFNDSMAVEIEVSRTAYRDQKVSSWNYTEKRVRYFMSQTASLQYSTSDNYYGFGYKSKGIEAYWSPNIYQNIVGIFAIGHTKLSNQLFDYDLTHSKLGLAWSKDAWSINLTHEGLSGDHQFLYPSSMTDSRFVLSVNYSIF